MRTLSITSYEKVTPHVARVVISYTGDHDRQSMVAAINEKFKGLAAAVENSFRPIQAGAAVGFIKANNEVRVVDALELKAGYRMLAKTNMMVDEKDQSLWTLRSGQGGSAFLTRQGQEDLSELLAAVHYRGRQDVPRVNQLSLSAAKEGEAVTFVTEDGDLDHGFVTKALDEDGMCQVEARVHGTYRVPYERISAIASVQIDPNIHQGVVQELRRELAAVYGPDAKATLKEYWSKVFSFDPEYLRKLFEAIDSPTVA